MGSGLGRGGIDVRGGTLYAPDMTLRTALLLLPGGLLGAVPPPGWSQTQAAPFYPDTAKVLQKVVTDARQHGDIPGAVVWVERDGSPVHFASGDRATVPATGRRADCRSEKNLEGSSGRTLGCSAMRC